MVKTNNEQSMTSIAVSHNNWRALMNRKRFPKESFDNVIERMILDTPEESDQERHEIAEDQLSAVLSNKERMKK